MERKELRPSEEAPPKIHSKRELNELIAPELVPLSAILLDIIDTVKNITQPKNLGGK